MKPTLMLLSILAVGFCEPGMAQNENRKLIGEDRAGQIALAQAASGRVEFTERRVDGNKAVYEVYVMQGDTLRKTIIDSYTGVVDTLIVDTVNGRACLQARILSQKRAKLAAKAAVAGEVMRWRLRLEDGIWFYRFQIETANSELKEVYVNEQDFKVACVKTFRVLDKDSAGATGKPKPN
jgi:uncharacterized membrane protein YkoI